MPCGYECFGRIVILVTALCVFLSPKESVFALIYIARFERQVGGVVFNNLPNLVIN